jgi:hypothetical protein
VALTSSSSFYFNITPSGSHVLDENLGDLQPRAHLYVTAGATNLPVTFPLNTTLLPNGFHDLTAVAYEGSHVRTQKRASQTVQVQNGSLSATFTTLYGGSNTDVGAMLQFAVAANTTAISKLELFSTGGLLGSVTNQYTTTFSVSGAYLGVGLHPFYALVTANTGQQYRTETKWIRLMGPEGPFNVSVSAPPPLLSWPATAGRSYDILTSTNLANPFQLNATMVPSNSTPLWLDTNPPASQRFYRIRTSQ